MARSSLVCSIWQRYDFIPNIWCYQPEKSADPKYPSFQEDLVNFGKSLLENPKQGTELAPGIRKIRMAIKSKGKGKSGGTRVITYNFITQKMDGKIVLLLIYDKEDASTAKVSVLKEIIKEEGYPIE